MDFGSSDKFKRYLLIGLVIRESGLKDHGTKYVIVFTKSKVAAVIKKKKKNGSVKHRY